MTLHLTMAVATKWYSLPNKIYVNTLQCTDDKTFTDQNEIYFIKSFLDNWGGGGGGGGGGLQIGAYVPKYLVGVATPVLLARDNVSMYTSQMIHCMCLLLARCNVYCINDQCRCLLFARCNVYGTNDSLYVLITRPLQCIRHKLSTVCA